MAAGRKKQMTIVKDTPLFDINEWIDIKRQELIRAGSWTDSEIKYVIKKHPKKDHCFILTIHFKKKILMMLDNSKDPRIMIMQHKKDDMRILMTRSANGYRTNQPSKKANTYNIKCIVRIPGLSLGDKTTKVIDPIFHEKGFSSGAIIEFKIEF